MTKSQPCVLIYNPISRHGHLDSWNALFIGFLLERGFRVLALTPDQMALKTRLMQRKLEGHPRLHVLDWDFTPSRMRLRLRIRRIWHWWLIYGQNYASKQPETHVTPGMPAHTRVKKRIFKILVPPLFFLSRALRTVLRQMRGERRLGDGLQDPPELHFLEPVEMAQRINAALRKSSWRPDCMFNMYLDMYKTDTTSWKEFSAICQLPWGGIRFVPSEAPPREGYYTLPSLRGVCFLDETTCIDYRASIQGKYFQYLPDFTNTELPETPYSLAETIQRRAAGRKIVFLGGSIGGQKNITRWCELIALADSKRWFFVQVGEIHLNTFSPEDAAAFERLLADPPENLILHTQYLSDERDFNAVIHAVDIIFAVYRDFRISSNMLAKAAYFERPILVSGEFLMGERVRHYGIGLTVSQNDVHAMLNAIEQLAAKPIPAKNFSSYRAVFRDQAVGDRLKSFLTGISLDLIPTST